MTLHRCFDIQKITKKKHWKLNIKVASKEHNKWHKGNNVCIYNSVQDNQEYSVSQKRHMFFKIINSSLTFQCWLNPVYPLVSTIHRVSLKEKEANNPTSILS